MTDTAEPLSPPREPELRASSLKMAIIFGVPGTRCPEETGDPPRSPYPRTPFSADLTLPSFQMQSRLVIPVNDRRRTWKQHVDRSSRLDPIRPLSRNPEPTSNSPTLSCVSCPSSPLPDYVFVACFHLPIDKSWFQGRLCGARKIVIRFNLRLVPPASNLYTTTHNRADLLFPSSQQDQQSPPAAVTARYGW
jgi:hypothetical protein